MSWYKTADMFSDTENHLWRDFLYEMFTKGEGLSQLFADTIRNILFENPKLFATIFEKPSDSDTEAAFKKAIYSIIEYGITQSFNAIFYALKQATTAKSAFVQEEVEVEKQIIDDKEKEDFVHQAKIIYDEYVNFIDDFYEFIKGAFQEHEVLKLFVKGNLVDFLDKQNQFKSLIKDLLDLFPYEATKVKEYLEVTEKVAASMDDWTKKRLALTKKANEFLAEHDNLTYEDHWGYGKKIMEEHKKNMSEFVETEEYYNEEEMEKEIMKQDYLFDSMKEDNLTF